MILYLSNGDEEKKNTHQKVNDQPVVIRYCISIRILVFGDEEKKTPAKKLTISARRCY